jgi:hypothetical protein
MLTPPTPRPEPDGEPLPLDEGPEPRPFTTVRLVDVQASGGTQDLAWHPELAPGLACPQCQEHPLKRHRSTVYCHFCRRRWWSRAPHTGGAPYLTALSKGGDCMAYADYYWSREWYARCDRVKSRAGRRCEFCLWRPIQHVHHRTYAHFGAEPLADLLAVCVLCHRAIHGLGGWPPRELVCHADSLLAAGDTGMDTTPQWEAYLATFDWCTRCENRIYGHNRAAPAGGWEHVRGVGLCGACQLRPAPPATASLTGRTP